eukprot:TRINITY_DN57173_c0_g1_i1.p1 TRINITY_DN57173_c0_g1~~TRINITY_DN57173_c0_g1_i1.p1  ORF type:complete len:829 (+),score=117.93 TRINITY_DN57173_c0_g1_i1:54-2540(+)
MPCHQRSLASASCAAVFWLLLIIACVCYTVSLLSALPQVIGFQENLHEALFEIIGFRRFDFDVAEVQRAASEMLSHCGADFTGHCPYGLETGLLPLSRTSATHLAVITASFGSSLSKIQQFSNDRFFSSGALTLTGSLLNTLAENWQTLRVGNLPCKNYTAIKCELFLGASDLLVEVPSSKAEVLKLVDQLTGEHFGVVSKIVYILLALPFVSLFPVAWLNRFPYSKKSKCRLCLLLLHFLLWLVFLPVSLVICIVGFDLTLELGLLRVSALDGKPPLATVLRHIGIEFPNVSSHVVGGELKYLYIFLASVAFVLLCLCVAFRLPGQRTAHGGKRAHTTADGVPLGVSFIDIPADGEWPKGPAEELEEISKLKPFQLRALEHIRKRSCKLHDEALPRLVARAQGLGFSEQEVAQALEWFGHQAPIIVHLDLERIGFLLTSDSHYRNQFETSTSGGTLDPNLRMKWEDELFNGAYKQAEPFDRCKYGALNVTNDPQGVRECRQYGYSYLLLRNVRLRTTFCATDSAGMPTDSLATVDFCAHVLEKFEDRELRATLRVATQKIPGLDSNVIGGYKEVQIHGEIRLADHVGIIMAHPSLRSVAAWSDMLAALQHRCRTTMVWIEGGVDTPVSHRPAPVPPSPAAIAAIAPSPPKTVKICLPNCPLVTGSKLIVEAHDGQLVEIVVPEDSWPGKWITVSYVPMASASFADERSDRYGSGSRSAGSGDASVAAGVDTAEAWRIEAMRHLDTHIESSSSSLPPEGWEVEGDDGKWESCAEEGLRAVRVAQVSGHRYAAFRVRGHHYEIDLHTGVQCNLASGRKRMVRKKQRLDL